LLADKFINLLLNKQDKALIIILFDPSALSIREVNHLILLTILAYNNQFIN